MNPTRVRSHPKLEARNTWKERSWSPEPAQIFYNHFPPSPSLQQGHCCSLKETTFSLAPHSYLQLPIPATPSPVLLFCPICLTPASSSAFDSYSVYPGKLPSLRLLQHTPLTALSNTLLSSLLCPNTKLLEARDHALFLTVSPRPRTMPVIWSSPHE